MKRYLYESSNPRLKELGYTISLDITIIFFEDKTSLLSVGRIVDPTRTTATKLGTLLVPIVINNNGSAEQGHDENIIDENDYGGKDTKTPD